MSPPLPAATVPSRIAQVAVVVQDLDRATAFYRDVLGVRFLFDVPGQMSFLDCGGVRLMLARGETPEQQRASSILYYEVADLDAAHRRIEDAGAPFEREPHRVAVLGANELWMAFLRDTEGNLLALTSERPAAAPPPG